MNNNDIYLRYFDRNDVDSLLAFRLRNNDFFQPFEPIRDESYFSLEGQEKEIAACILGVKNEQSYTFGIFLQATDELLGRIALTSVSRGPFQNAYMGYNIDQQHNGKGYGTAAVSLCVTFAFEQLGLHRIQAGVMPRNLPSIRVLEKIGFRQEGLAQKYLKINGKWEDHVLFAITAED
ncbi:MAG: GNAT family N-acetyltransferase [Candidatus Pristimantibacillus sp.]